MSYSLLIVDDEAIDRSGIRQLAESELPDITDIREASNGVEFIRSVEDRSPDIVVLDINMPGLSGLEALDLVRRKGFSGKVIIHTAFDKFQYAHDAINLAADAFLLKPVKRKILLEMIRKLILELEDSLRTEHEQKKLETIVRELLPIVRSDLIAALLFGNGNTNQLLTHFSSIGHSFRIGVMLTLKLPDTFFHKDDFPSTGRKARILEMITEFLDDGRTGFAGLIVSRKVPILLFPPHLPDEFRSRIWAIEQAERIRLYIKNEFFINVSIGIGSAVRELSSLSRSYRESLLALDRTHKEQTVHHFSDTSNHKDSFDPIAVAGELLDNGWPDLENEEIWFCRRFDSGNGLDWQKDRVLSVLFELRRQTLIEELTEEPSSVGNRVFFQKIASPSSEQKLREVFRELFSEIAEAAEPSRNPAMHEGVRKAHRYIEENFMRNISLDIVAEHVGISPYYLSHLFKESTGNTYIGFLTQYRVEMAQRFIEQQRHSLSEIATKCGYSNPLYFAKVFRKACGTTLSERNGVCVIE